MTLTPEQQRREKIAGRVEAATDGPWSPGLGEADDDVNVWDSAEVPSRAVAHDIFKDADRDFIAHAREDIPWLLDQLEQAERRYGDALDFISASGEDALEEFLAAQDTATATAVAPKEGSNG